jgi:hypothetical protein
MAHAWALSTSQWTVRHLGRLDSLGRTYDINLFPGAPINRPPRLVIIPLLWGVLEYTLQASRKTGKGIKYNPARSLQSAASACHLWEKMLQFPSHMYRDMDSNVIGAPWLSPTDSVIATLGKRCTRRRLGTENSPPSSSRIQSCGFQPGVQGGGIMMGAGMTG